MLESYLSTAGVVLPFLLKGFWETLKISFVAIIAGSLLVPAPTCRASTWSATTDRQPASSALRCQSVSSE